jgi:hypothetical protein
MELIAPVEPVAYRGKMLSTGYQPENHEWRDLLCNRDELGNLVGKDPMTIPLDVLTASGHPRASVRSIVFRLRVMQGMDTGEMRHDDLPFPTPRKLKGDVRQYCLECCGENTAEVRRCALYDCPAWPFRMGHNPHNPRRGVNPFAKTTQTEASADT